jgi:hypothetical protein
MVILHILGTGLLYFPHSSSFLPNENQNCKNVYFSMLPPLPLSASKHMSENNKMKEKKMKILSTFCIKMLVLAIVMPLKR